MVLLDCVQHEVICFDPGELLAIYFDQEKPLPICSGPKNHQATYFAPGRQMEYREEAICFALRKPQLDTCFGLDVQSMTLIGQGEKQKIVQVTSGATLSWKLSYKFMCSF